MQRDAKPHSDGLIHGIPDIQVNINFVGFGYQADIYAKGKPARTVCRDFGGTHGIRKLMTRFLRMFPEWMALDFRKNL